MLSVLLIISACSLLPLQMVGGQSISTITYWFTTMQQVTVPTSYATHFVTNVNQTVTSTIQSPTTFDVNAPIDAMYQNGFYAGNLQYGCFNVNFEYNVVAGDIVQGNWTSNGAINFYIMPESAHEAYKDCGSPPLSTYLRVQAASYSLNWVAPESGTVYLVFENYASGYQSELRTISLTLYKLGATSSTSTVYTTVSIPTVASTIETLNSVYYSTLSTLPSPLLTLKSSVPLPLVLAVIIGAVVVLFLLNWRPRPAPKRRT